MIARNQRTLGLRVSDACRLHVECVDKRDSLQNVLGLNELQAQAIDKIINLGSDLRCPARTSS
jgi:hypothetical protein